MFLYGFSCGERLSSDSVSKMSAAVWWQFLVLLLNFKLHLHFCFDCGSSSQFGSRNQVGDLDGLAVASAIQVTWASTSMSASTLRTPPPKGPTPDGYRPVWQVKGDDPWGWPTQRIDYNDEYNAVIELAFQNGIFSLDYQPGKSQVFQINFDGMTQTNVTSSTVRAIRRILVHERSDVDPMDEWDVPQTVIVDLAADPDNNTVPTLAYASPDLMAAVPP